MRKLTLLFLLLLGASLAQSQEISLDKVLDDPVGDLLGDPSITKPDLIGLYAGFDDSTLVLKLEFNDIVVPDSTLCAFGLDTDQNINTGAYPPGSGLPGASLNPLQDIGSDFETVWDLPNALGAGSNLLLMTYDAEILAVLPVVVDSNTISATIPLALLGNDDGNINITGGAVFSLTATAIDFMPDAGHGVIGEDVPLVGGTLLAKSFFSPAMNDTMEYEIYLPEGYRPDRETEYRVIYLLHGAGGSHNSPDLAEMNVVLDSLIANGIIDPVILVKPDGSAPPYLGSFYTNSALYGPFEDYIVFDLVTHIDSTYNTTAERNERGIMGYSMGGYGAMKLGLKHPDIFRGAASHSGPLDLTQILIFAPLVFAESGGTPPFTYNPANGLASLLLFTAAGAFSPNLANPPFFVDFPLDSDGNVVDSTFAKYIPHSPASIASQLEPNSDFAIYFGVGRQDDLAQFPFNTAFRDSLDKFGVDYQFRPFDGTVHGSKRYLEIAWGLAFLDSVMKAAPTDVFEEVGNMPQTFALQQNYPNPFNPTTTIHYTLSELQNNKVVTLEIFNLLGQRIRSLVHTKQRAGTYSVQWDGRTNAGAQVASGVYIYRLRATGLVESRKMLLVR
ncbi:MAG: alpha/beta hydrolase-fold protein [bacterium]